MEQIKIIFFAISTFLGIENGQILATSTTVTVFPKKKELIIVQDELSAVLMNSNSKNAVLEEWKTISAQDSATYEWSEELKGFDNKKLVITTNESEITTKISMTYTDVSQLRAMGIWFNEQENSFSINEIPQYGITTTDGVIDGNYWKFKDQPFSFTINPFKSAPENILALKKSLKDILE